MRKKEVALSLGIVVTVLIIAIVLLQTLRTTNALTAIPVEDKLQSIATMTNTEPVKKTGEQLMVSILGDESERTNDVVLQNAVRAFTYAKVPFQFVKPADVSTLKPSPYHVLMVTNEYAERWPYEDIKQFVEKGGRLYAAMRFHDPKWNELLGIQANLGFHEKEMYGFQFVKPFFPGYENISENNKSFGNSMLNVTLQSSTDIYMQVEDTALLWTNDYGAGKVVFWNATFLGEKLMRGMLVQGVGLAVPRFVSAQAAIKVVFIDDFPAPLPSWDVPVIREEYNMSTDDFYHRVWWEDMKTLATQHSIRYTNVMIGTYKANTMMNAEELINLNENDLIYYGRDTLQNGHELGLHGYNHQPLVTKDEPVDPAFEYVPWESQEQMEEGLRNVQRMFETLYTGISIQSYVPPSNVLNKTGLQAIMNALPNIKVLAALYTGAAEDGSFIQEFETDAQYPELYHLPRVSSGYKQLPENAFALTDAIANFGVFSHFVHPDDVLDPYRSRNLGWKDLKKELDTLLTQVGAMYPYLKPYTASEAREKLLKYEKASVEVYYSSNSITISGTDIVNPADVIVRLEEGQKLDTGTFGDRIVHQLDSDLPIYSVTFTKPLITLSIK